MGIKAKFTKADVANIMKAKLMQVEQAILNRLILIGERFVINARTNHTYLDQTGNLTSSIAYIVLKNGQPVSESYQGAGTGTASARRLIQELKAQFLNGYSLIVVAGMDYAAAVESRGRDVLTASSKIAQRELKQAMKDIKNKLKDI